MTATVMRVGADQRARTKAEEGFSAEAYLDNQDPPVPTVGFGHAATNPRPVRGTLNGKPYVGPVKMGVKITPQEAERLFDEDMEEVEHIISGAVSHDLTVGQMGACADFVFQFGPNNFLGSTLLKKINFNPTNLEAVLPEFARWNIVAGKRNEAIYRRSCRRACVYAGVQIPDLLWKSAKSGFPWAVQPHGEIDHDITPTVFELVVMGKDQEKGKTSPKAAGGPAESRQASPAAKQAPQAETSPQATPDSNSDILFEQAAPEAKATAAGAEPVIQAASPSPAPASAPSPIPSAAAGPTTASEAEPAAASPAAGAGGAGVSRPSQPALPVPVGTKPLSPNTVPAGQSPPYGVDTSAGSKPMKESDRYKGARIEDFGSILIRVSGLGWLGNTAQTVSKGVMSDPVLMSLVLSSLGFFAISLGGFLVAKYGEWKRKEGERAAVQLLH